MDLITISEQIERSIAWFTTSSESLAVSKAEYEHKEDYKKTQLAICELQAHGITQKEIERIALASQEYQDFLQELNLTRLNYLKRKCEWEARMAAFDGLRSLNKNLQ